MSKSAKTTTGVAARVHARCFGALTSKSYAFKARPWELQSVSTYDATDGNLLPIQAQLKDAKIVRMLPGGPGFITDRARFSFDGLYRNRTAHVFSKSDAEEWSRASWSDFFLWMKDLAGTSTRGTVVVGPEVDLKTLAALKELSSTVDIKVTGVGSPYVPTESIDDLCSLGALGSAHPLSFEQDVLDRAERDGPDGGKALVIVLGANVMKENVLLHTQFKSAYQKDLADFVTVGTTLNDNQFPSTYMSYNDFAAAAASGDLAASVSAEYGDNVHVFYGGEFWQAPRAMETQRALAAMPCAAPAKHLWTRSGHCGQVHCSSTEFFDLSPEAFAPSDDDAFVWLIGVSWSDIMDSPQASSPGWKAFLDKSVPKGYKTIVQSAFGDDVLAANYADFILPSKSHLEQAAVYAKAFQNGIGGGLDAKDLVTCTPLYATSRFDQRDDWDIVQAVHATVAEGASINFINAMDQIEATGYILKSLSGEALPFSKGAGNGSGNADPNAGRLPTAIALNSDSAIVRNSETIQASKRELYEPQNSFDGIRPVNAPLL